MPIRRRGRLPAAAAAIAVAGGLALTGYALSASRGVIPPAPSGHQRIVVAASAPSAASAQSQGNAPSPPVRISIPSIAVSSVLGPSRGLTPAGTIDDAPLSGPVWALPWWYDRGPAPGADGSSVILGHVDSASGAGHLGVFFRLGDLRPGNAVVVTLADGSVTRWKVLSVRMYSDTSFPDGLVYDPAGPPRLRLVTCGGAFNWTTHHYESAIVVTAAPTGASPRR
jgi:hypothetical protein